MREKDLKLSQEQFEELWQCVDRTRSTSKTVKVPIGAFRNVLMDHATMIDEVDQDAAYGRLTRMMK